MRNLHVVVTCITVVTLLAALAFAAAPVSAPAAPTPTSASADTISREAQLAIGHVERILPLILERWDNDLRAALDEAVRANRGEMNPQQTDAVVLREDGSFTYIDDNARIDKIMACEHAAALCSRRLDLVERGLYFEAFPPDTAEWVNGTVGLLNIGGEFDQPRDRIVTVLQVIGPKRVLATARLTGTDQRPGKPFILDGIAAKGLRVGDVVVVRREPLAVVTSETRISVNASVTIPVLRPVNLKRFGSAIADAGANVVEDYRRHHPRPTR